MFYHLDIEEQLSRIMNRISFRSLCQNKVTDSNELRDICDGNYYNSLLDSEDGQLFEKKEALTFIINTDGASICKSSSLTIWPVYLVCNEISNKFSLENVVLAGNSLSYVYLF